MDDEAIAEALGRALHEHGLYGVLADVADGRVTLTGEVETRADEDRAVELAAAMPGVTSVAPELVVPG
jgi:osmotically-inducible protein OsmY